MFPPFWQDQTVPDRNKHSAQSLKNAKQVKISSLPFYPKQNGTEIKQILSLICATWMQKFAVTIVGDQKHFCIYFLEYRHSFLDLVPL